MHEPGPPRRCRGLGWTVDWDKATVAVSTPRRCLGNPRWVRIGVNVVSDDPGAVHLDDAVRAGSGECPDCVLERVVYSPRIDRG